MPGDPAEGTVIDSGDGSGEVAVAFIRLNLRPVEFSPGFYPTGVEIRTESETGDRLPKAEVAGWKAMA